MLDTRTPSPEMLPSDLQEQVTHLPRRTLETPPDLARHSPHRAAFRPQSASATAPYPLGTAPINNKMSTLERVRMENTWLREELESVRKELASEKHISQYRWRSYEGKLADSEAKRAEMEAAFEQARNGNREMVKRREGLVHRVKDEERSRRIVRERLVRRLFHSDLEGSKNNGMADWILTKGGMGDYFLEWRRSGRHQPDNQTGEGVGDHEIFKARDLGRSFERSLRRLEQQRNFLLRQERRSLSPEQCAERLDRRPSHQESMQLDQPAARAPYRTLQVRGDIGKIEHEQDSGGLQLDVHEHTRAGHATRGGLAAFTKAFDTNSTFVRLEENEAAGLRREILGCDEAAADPALTQREKDLLGTATQEICARKHLERAFDEERCQFREHVRSVVARCLLLCIAACLCDSFSECLNISAESWCTT